MSLRKSDFLEEQYYQHNGLNNEEETINIIILIKQTGGGLKRIWKMSAYTVFLRLRRQEERRNEKLKEK